MPFHSPATTPPGRSTRAISVSAASTSNQWNAWPAGTGTPLIGGCAGAYAEHCPAYLLDALRTGCAAFKLPR
ncbi:hypothetical protein L1857_34905 [Amycolatopsis thermalba]|uniref:Uncharacterized protein n=1 Tax=Amycolatopsis thermalba TaxID=944492 RepID=A0ABY4P5M5_9PSEU|nr:MULTISPECIES: hypothetical protein [Amycolatopsis]UQS27624.1 hypothetical protein L1857_34905 [Amycolatopsis thermalba]